MLLVFHDQCRIPQQPSKFDSPKRSIAKALPKTGLIHCKQLGKIDGIRSGPRLKTFIAANGRVAVPGTSLLTCIAAIQSLAAGLSQFLGNWAGRFDSQVTDALSPHQDDKGLPKHPSDSIQDKSGNRRSDLTIVGSSNCSSSVVNKAAKKIQLPNFSFISNVFLPDPAKTGTLRTAAFQKRGRIDNSANARNEVPVGDEFGPIPATCGELLRDNRSPTHNERQFLVQVRQ